MHIDENKKFDKRNLEKNIKDGTISGKDYEMFLSKLPDVTDKLYSPEEELGESGEIEERKEGESSNRKKKKKGKTR